VPGICAVTIKDILKEEEEEEEEDGIANNSANLHLQS